jgi:hypothetical protein
MATLQKKVHYAANERLDLNDKLADIDLVDDTIHEYVKNIALSGDVDGRVFFGWRTTTTTGPDVGFTIAAEPALAVSRDGKIMLRDGATALTRALVANSINYIYAHYTENDSDSDNRRFFTPPTGPEYTASTATRITRTASLYSTTKPYGAGTPSYSDFDASANIGGIIRQLIPLYAIAVNAGDTVTSVTDFRPMFSFINAGAGSNVYEANVADAPHNFSPTDLATLGITDIRKGFVALADRLKNLKQTSTWYADNFNNVVLSGSIFNTVDNALTTWYGGTSGNGGNITLFGGTHATLANKAYYNAVDHTWRSQNGVTTYGRMEGTGLNMFLGNIYRNVTNSSLTLDGGTLGFGAALDLYGGTHGTTPNRARNRAIEHLWTDTGGTEWARLTANGLALGVTTTKDGAVSYAKFATSLTGTAGSGTLPANTSYWSQGAYATGSVDSIYNRWQMSVNESADFGSYLNQRRDAGGLGWTHIGHRSAGVDTDCITISKNWDSIVALNWTYGTGPALNRGILMSNHTTDGLLFDILNTGADYAYTTVQSNIYYDVGWKARSLRSGGSMLVMGRFLGAGAGSEGYVGLAVSTNAAAGITPGAALNLITPFGAYKNGSVGIGNNAGDGASVPNTGLLVDTSSGLGLDAMFGNVIATGRAAGRIYSNDSVCVGLSANIYYDGATNRRVKAGGGGEIDIYHGITDGVNAGSIVFNTWINGAADSSITGLERMRIKGNTGFVGIGTDAPLTRMHAAESTAGAPVYPMVISNSAVKTLNNAVALGFLTSSTSALGTGADAQVYVNSRGGASNTSIMRFDVRDDTNTLVPIALMTGANSVGYPLTSGGIIPVALSGIYDLGYPTLFWKNAYALQFVVNYTGTIGKMYWSNPNVVISTNTATPTTLFVGNNRIVLPALNVVIGSLAEDAIATAGAMYFNTSTSGIFRYCKNGTSFVSF